MGRHGGFPPVAPRCFEWVSPASISGFNMWMAGLTTAAPQAGGVAAQEKVSRRMGGFTGGWGVHHPALIQRPGGPSGSSNESAHRGPPRWVLVVLSQIVAKLGEQFYTDATGQTSASFPNQSRGAMEGYHARFATLPR